MFRICSSRKLISRPLFSFASVRTEKWAELTRIHLGSELRANANAEDVSAMSGTIRNSCREREQKRGMVSQACETSDARMLPRCCAGAAMDASAPLFAREPLGCPLGALRHHCIVVGFEFIQQWPKPPVAAVAHRDHCISSQAAALGPPYGRSTKFFPEFFGGHSSQPLQRGIDQSFARLKFRSVARGSFAVPRAYILADVAPKDLVSHARAHVLGDRAALFDGQIGNAAVRVQLIGRHQRISGTGFDAARATAASIRCRQIGFKLQRSQDDTQEQPRSQLLINDAGVLSNPPDP